MEQPITALQTPDCDWLLHSFIEVNFSKLTDSNQIFRKDFVGLHYHLCKISSQIIECIIFAPYELYNYLLYGNNYRSLLIYSMQELHIVMNCVGPKNRVGGIKNQYYNQIRVSGFEQFCLSRDSGKKLL